MTLLFFIPLMRDIHIIIQKTLWKLILMLVLLKKKEIFVCCSSFFPFLCSFFFLFKHNRVFFLIVNFVDLTSSKETELRSRDTLLQEGFIYIMGITGATGLPVELCNDNDFENGKCGRGLEICLYLFPYPYILRFLRRCLFSHLFKSQYKSIFKSINRFPIGRTKLLD